MNLKENNLIKISFILFLFLFSLLYYLDKNYSPELISISDIDKSYFNKVVKIEAKIEKQNLNNGTLFLKLSDLKNNSFKIEGIIFKINKTFKKENNYEVIGKISLYKNDLEILIEKIKVI